MEGIDAVLATMLGQAWDEKRWRRRCAAVIQRYGLKKVSAIGHSHRHRLSAGLGRAHDQPKSGRHNVLQPGNVLHCILGMWMEGWGIEVSETILVTERGCETLTNFPRRIHQK